MSGKNRTARGRRHHAVPLLTQQAIARPLYLPLVVAATVAAAAVFTMALRYGGESAPASLDRWVSSLSDGPLFAPAIAHAFASVVAVGGHPLGAAALAGALALLCGVLGRGRLAVLAIAGPGLAVMATLVLKQLVGRTIHGPFLAFPSGHTAMLTAAGLVVAMLVVSLVRAGRLAGTLLILAGGTVAGMAMAWSQISLGNHYPTDTLGGFCTALALVPAAAWLTDHIAERAATRRSVTRGHRSGESDDVMGSDDGRTDHLGLQLRNKQVPRTLRGSVLLLARAVSAVYTAARRPFLVTVVLTVVGAAVPIAQVLVTIWLLDALLAGTAAGSIGSLLPLLALLAGLTACSFGLTGATAQLQRMVAGRVTRDTQRKVLGVTSTVGLDTYESAWFFHRVARIEANSLTKPAEIAQSLVAIAAGTFAATGLAVVLILIDPLLLPVLAVIVVPIWVAGRIGSRSEFDFAVRQSEGLTERNYLATVLKIREMAKEIRAFELAGLLIGRWQQRYDDYLSGLRGLVRMRIAVSAGAAVLTGGFLLAAMLLLLWRVRGGHISLAEAGAALVAMRMLTARLQTTAGGGGKLYESQLFLRDLHEFLELGERFQSPVAGGAGRSAPAGGFDRLVVDGVSYAYPGSDAQVLDDVSVEIGRGEVVALVGENGSGKTTLAKILAGLHTPDSGEVYWDGHAVSEMDQDCLRRRVAVVFQDFARYELSALDNIAVGRARDAVDVDDVHRAAALAGIAPCVESLPQGYDTLLGRLRPGSTDLSVGQWQRIALARVIYRDAEFVVLDEPTSALDPRAEHELFTRMRELFRGRTVLLISHRFSSTRSADRIYVLDSGRLVEQGTHDELMSEHGTYRELFTLQALSG